MLNKRDFLKNINLYLCRLEKHGSIDILEEFLIQSGSFRLKFDLILTHWHSKLDRL